MNDFAGLFKLIMMDNIKYSINYIEGEHITNVQHIIPRDCDTFVFDTIILPTSINISEYTLEVTVEDKILWNISLPLIMDTSKVTTTKQGEYVIQLNDKLFSDMSHHTIMPLVALQYSSVKFNLKTASGLETKSYRIIFKHFYHNTDERRLCATSSHNIKVNTYNQINIASNRLECFNTIPIFGLFVISTHKLYNIMVNCNGTNLVNYNQIILNKYLVSKQQTPHAKEYFYDISVPTTEYTTCNITIDLTTNNNKLVDGCIYLKQHKNFIIDNGRGFIK